MENVDYLVSTPLLSEYKGGVLWLTLNRAQALNALDRPLSALLLKAFDSARLDDSCRAIVVTGSGRAFCAGDDITGIKAFLEGRTEDASVATDPNDGVTLYLRIAQAMRLCPKPIIAAINGPAFGAGMELLCAADLRCIAKSAQIGSSLVNIGAAGNVAMLGAVIGESRAMELYLSGRAVSSHEALEIGLVNYLYDDENFLDSVSSLAHAISQKPTKVIGIQKKLLNDCRGKSIMERLGLQDEAHRSCMAECADAIEGAKAFLDKRKPVFSGN